VLFECQQQAPKAAQEWKWKEGAGQDQDIQVDGQVASIEAKDMSITLTITSPEGEGLKSTSNESTPCCQPAVNDDGTVSMEVNGMLAQLCLDLNEHPEDANALVAKI
jgi:hypothetical protein